MYRHPPVYKANANTDADAVQIDMWPQKCQVAA